MKAKRIKHGLNAYLYSFIYPFTQKDWIQKMWIFAVISYVPVVSIIIVRGWRLEFVHRIGWGYEKPLPSPRDVVKFFSNGLLLWMVNGLFLMVPLIIISVLGLGGLRELWNDSVQFFSMIWDFMWSSMSVKEFGASISVFAKNELWESFRAFLIENIYLLFYIPIYRIGMIRFALTKNLKASHLAFRKNLRFIYQNFLEVVLLYAFFLVEFLVVFIVNSVLIMTVIGIPLIPIFTVYMYYWSTGYEYGHIARLMVEQEGLIRPETETQTVNQ